MILYGKNSEVKPIKSDSSEDPSQTKIEDENQEKASPQLRELTD